MKTQLKAIIFDLDGVITNTAMFHYRAWKRLADELNIYFDEGINERLKGIDRLNSLRIILERADRDYTDYEIKELAERKNEYYKELINTMTPKEILPGAKQLLAKLKELNIKTGLASVSKNAFTVLKRLEMCQYFDYIADASKIRKGKPDPEIFLTVAENLNVNPKNCMGVEDAEAGIAAIKAAGMYAVGVGDPDMLKEADDVIPNLEYFNIGKYI